MSKQRNFRPRTKLDDDEEEGAAEAKQPAPAIKAPAAAATAAAQIPQQQSKPLQRPSLLSFDEDVEDGQPLGGTSMGGSKGSKGKKDRGRAKLRAQPLPEVPVVTTASQRSGAGGCGL